MRSALSSCLCAMLGHRVCSQDTAGGISKARHISRLGPSLNAIRYNKHSTVVACLGWGKRAETGRAAMREDTAKQAHLSLPPQPASQAPKASAILAFKPCPLSFRPFAIHVPCQEDPGSNQKGYLLENHSKHTVHERTTPVQILILRPPCAASPQPSMQTLFNLSPPSFCLPSLWIDTSPPQGLSPWTEA